MNSGTVSCRQAPDYAAALAAFAVPCLLLFRQIDDPDVWYHLVIGREVFHTLRIPATEFFIYPLLGSPAAFHEWGFGLLFYSAYHWFGYAGLAAANAALGAAPFLLLFLAMRRARVGPPVMLLVLAITLWYVQERLVYRPEMVLFVCMAAEIWLLEAYGETRDWRWLVPIPLLFAALSSFHPSALMLLIVLAVYGAQFIWTGIRQKRLSARPALGFALLLAVSFCLAAVNPYGFNQVLLPLTFAQKHELLQGIAEFMSVFEAGYGWPFMALAGAGLAASLAVAGRRLAYLLLWLLFAYLAFSHVRNLAMFALLMAVPIARGAGLLHQRLPSSHAAARLLWLAALLAACAVGWRMLSGWHQWGYGPDPRGTPIAAAQHIGELKPAGNIVNFYHFGGYLAWALHDDYLAYIDGRHYEMDATLRQHDALFSGKDGWEDILRDLNASAVVMPATELFSGAYLELVPALAASRDWLLASTEPAGLLFLRRDVPTSRPFAPLDRKRIWQQLVVEAERNLSQYPDHAGAYNSLGFAYFNLGRLDDAATALRRYLQLRPGDETIMRALESIEKRRQRRQAVP